MIEVNKTVSHGVYKLIFDKEGLNLYEKYSWYLARKRNGFYLARKINRNKTSYFARELLNVSNKTEIVDHINRNPLDNRKENLRIVSHNFNLMNVGKKKTKKTPTSKFKGIYWSSQKQKWLVEFRYKSKRYHVGVFISEEDAQNAYNTKINEIVK